jgi:hypothetical protein
MAWSLYSTAPWSLAVNMHSNMAKGNHTMFRPKISTQSHYHGFNDGTVRLEPDAWLLNRNDDITFSMLSGKNAAVVGGLIGL